MDSDQAKLFIGGISWETSEDNLKEYFGKYGDVLQTVVMRDKLTGKPRGFAFVSFSEPSIVDRVLQDSHTIDGRTVEAKRAMSRDEQQTSSRSGNGNATRNTRSSGGGFRTKKIFVGGLPPTLSEEAFRQYFENFGQVTDVVVMYDQTTQRPRGFGFISFDNEDAVDAVLHKTFHDLGGKQVEVKRALPKDANPGGGIRSSGNYQSYSGNSGGSSGGYDGRSDSNRYMQPQNTGGSFPPYGSTGFGTSGYGYGPGNSGMGYGGFGGPNSGYGVHGGPGYGNPNVPNGGAPRSSWNSQAPSGYGSTGYGNAGGWNSGGPGPVGQSPTGAGGYGNQIYGYGGYGGNNSSYPNQSGYVSVGGRGGGIPDSSNGIGGGELQGTGGGGYIGGGYPDSNVTSQPYGNLAPANYGGSHANVLHTGQSGYGSAGYGAQIRPAQQ